MSRSNKDELDFFDYDDRLKYKREKLDEYRQMKNRNWVEEIKIREAKKKKSISVDPTVIITWAAVIITILSVALPHMLSEWVPQAWAWLFYVGGLVLATAGVMEYLNIRKKQVQSCERLSLEIEAIQEMLKPKKINKIK